MVFFKFAVKIRKIKVELILDSLGVLVVDIFFFLYFFQFGLGFVFRISLVLDFFIGRKLNAGHQKLFPSDISHGDAFACISDFSSTAVDNVDSHKLVHVINQRIVNGFRQLVNDQFE